MTSSRVPIDRIGTAVRDLADALKAGQSGRLRAFLAMAARLPRYSVGNLVLIAEQRPTATRLAGFDTWKKLGRFVKRGEKGIAIVAPLVPRSRFDSGDALEDERAAVLRPVLGYRVVYVFDVAQTDGEALPELARAAGEPGRNLEALRAAVESFGLNLSYSAWLDGADGLSEGGSIVMRRDLSAAEEFHGLVHELAHELMHQTGRLFSTSQTQRELEAEAVACIVSEAVGIKALDASVDYIQLYRGSHVGFQESLTAIKRAAELILEKLKRAPWHSAPPAAKLSTASVSDSSIDSSNLVRSSMSR